MHSSCFYSVPAGRREQYRPHPTQTLRFAFARVKIFTNFLAFAAGRKMISAKSLMAHFGGLSGFSVRIQPKL
jgi:hypothetical protein